MPNKKILIAIVPILAAIIATVADLIGIIDILGSDWFWKKTPQFNVKADSPRGTLFSNKSDLPETYRFFATGLWSYNRTAGLIHNAGGYPERPNAPGHYRLPGEAEGALILRRSDGSYELIGSDRQLQLKSQEKVYFTINDAKDEARNYDSYSDNSGTLKVEWICETCQ